MEVKRVARAWRMGAKVGHRLCYVIVPVANGCVDSDNPSLPKPLALSTDIQSCCERKARHWTGFKYEAQTDHGIVYHLDVLELSN